MIKIPTKKRPLKYSKKQIRAVYKFQDLRIGDKALSKIHKKIKDEKVDFSNISLIGEIAKNARRKTITEKDVRLFFAISS